MRGHSEVTLPKEGAKHLRLRRGAHEDIDVRVTTSLCDGVCHRGQDRPDTATATAIPRYTATLPTC